MMVRKLSAVLMAAVAVCLAGCDDGSHPRAHASAPAPPATSVQACPVGRAQMGCAERTAAQNPRGALKFGAPSGPLFPDVSSWQGDVGWNAVAHWQDAHGWHRAAVFKMGEYRLDPFAGRNASLTSQLHFWRAGYWFVRNTGCQNEAAQIISAARSFGLKIVVEDDEVPEAAGYSTCLTPALRAAGLTVIIYAGTGTWPGGHPFNSPLWIASYGPGFGCLWTCHPVAWQFTDGTFNAPVDIPGIGKDDVSVDYGITKLGGAPPRVHCFGPHRAHSHACDVTRWRVGHWQRTIAVTRRQLTASGCWRYRNHKTAPAPCGHLFAYGDELHRDVAANLY